MTLVYAMLLDALIGEPKWLWSRVPHPAILMGRAVAALDEGLNKGQNRQLMGVLTLAVLVTGAALLGFALHAVPGNLIDIIAVAILLAQKSLVEHVSAVSRGLRMSLSQGRRDVAKIVGRDTKGMDQPAVARSAIESAAENLSDGVIAPAVWFLIAGLPGLLIYKITNTADSMIGYRTEKYAEFGWAAARFDDLLNFIPSRITACLIWLTSPNTQTPTAIFHEAPKHRSPNAGWPEAAIAYRLDIAISGPRSYDGEMRAFPFVNEDGDHNIGPAQIVQATATLWQTWGLAVFAVLLIALF